MVVGFSRLVVYLTRTMTPHATEMKHCFRHWWQRATTLAWLVVIVAHQYRTMAVLNDNISHCRYLKVMTQRSLEVQGFSTNKQKCPCPYCLFESDGYRLRRHLLSLHDRVTKEDIRRSPGRDRRLDLTARNLRCLTGATREAVYQQLYKRTQKSHPASRPSLLTQWIQQKEKIKTGWSGTRNNRRVQFVVV